MCLFYWHINIDMNFKRFYYSEYLEKISSEDRYKPILIIDDVLIVNFDSCTDRDYTLRGKEELIYLIHEHGQNKKVLFVFEDGANPLFTGAAEIIKNVIATLNLTKDTCAIFAREHLNIDNATIICEDSIHYWARALGMYLKDVALPQGPFNKKFSVWYNRGTMLRAKVVKQLVEKYRDDSFISYAEHGIVVDGKFDQYLTDDLVWAQSNTPIKYDDKWPQSRIYDFELIVGAERKPYNEYFMEIVVETDTTSYSWITEKTIKNFYVGKAFLMMCGAHGLEHLRSFGFKTFSPWINESYDSMENNYLRFSAIQQEIDRIGSMSYAELNDMHKEMIPIHEHNRKLINDFYFKRR